MIILRALKYLFFTIISLCLVTFLYLITSKDVTQKIFNYLSVEFPIKYSKVDGSIYEGIKIYDLNYDDMIKAKTIYLKLNIISLLVKEINISDLKVENITIEDKLISFIKESNETQNENSSFEFPFSLVIKNLELSMYDFSYENQKIDISGHKTLLLGNINSYAGGKPLDKTVVYTDKQLNVFRIKRLWGMIRLVSGRGCESQNEKSNSFVLNLGYDTMGQIDGEPHPFSKGVHRIELIGQVKVIGG